MCETLAGANFANLFPTRRLLVSNVPNDCSKRELAHVFRPYGCSDLAFVHGSTRTGAIPHPTDPPRGKTCVVVFEDTESCAKAFASLNRYAIGRFRLRLEFVGPRECPLYDPLDNWETWP